VSNFKFESTALQYSIVAGYKAHYRGIVTVNGAPGYGFALTATDGQVNGGDGYDKFRIKIWYGAPGTLVYDNEIGKMDGADPSTLISGGSIVMNDKSRRQ
jgi:hypothetical protein